jgi:hypothetical protein
MYVSKFLRNIFIYFRKKKNLLIFSGQRRDIQSRHYNRSRLFLTLTQLLDLATVEIIKLLEPQ